MARRWRYPERDDRRIAFIGRAFPLFEFTYVAVQRRHRGEWSIYANFQAPRSPGLSPGACDDRLRRHPSRLPTFALAPAKRSVGGPFWRA